MAYTAYDSTLPNPATQTGTAFGQRTRDNIRALRDVLVATGMLQGFNYYPTGGTAAEPATLYYRRTASTECVKIVLTWTSGNVTKMAFYYAAAETHASFPTSTNGTYDAMADAGGLYVCTLTYDGSGNCTATTWGSTP